MINSIEFPMTPITEDTFERQGWERHIDTDGGVDEDEPSEYYYYILPLPRDNPDENAPALASSTNDEYKDIPDMKKGEYYVEIDGLFGLGFCKYEEELESLYKNLTSLPIEWHIVIDFVTKTDNMSYDYVTK